MTSFPKELSNIRSLYISHTLQESHDLSVAEIIVLRLREAIFCQINKQWEVTAREQLTPHMTCLVLSNTERMRTGESPDNQK